MTYTGPDRRQVCANSSDHDLLISIHTLLDTHVKRFEEHVLSDDLRERDTVRALGQMKTQQDRLLIVGGLMVAVFQVIMKVWR